MWNMSKTADRRVKRTKIWDLGVLQCIYVGYLWWPIPWDWFGVIWCTLQNFQIYDFQNTTPPPNFHLISSNFIQGIIIMGQYRLFTVLLICPKLKKKYGFLIFFLTHDHIQLQISNCYFSHNFHWSPSKLFENIGYRNKSNCLRLVPKITYSI